jgi:hypothetical protein
VKLEEMERKERSKGNGAKGMKWSERKKWKNERNGAKNDMTNTNKRIKES